MRLLGRQRWLAHLAWGIPAAERGRVLQASPLSFVLFPDCGLRCRQTISVWLTHLWGEAFGTCRTVAVHRWTRPCSRLLLGKSNQTTCHRTFAPLEDHL